MEIHPAIARVLRKHDAAMEPVNYRQRTALIYIEEHVRLIRELSKDADIDLDGELKLLEEQLMTVKSMKRDDA